MGSSSFCLIFVFFVLMRAMTLKSHRDVISIWPNKAILVRALADVDPKNAPNKGAVNMWNVRGKIPAECYELVAEAATRRGYPEVTVRLLDELARAGA